MTTPIIAFGCIALNRLTELKVALDRVLGHVDHAIVIDGGSVDDSLWWLKGLQASRARRGLHDIHVVVAPWRDDFSWSRNQYVAKALELGCTHLLVGDTDEWFSPDFMLNLRTVISLLDSFGAYCGEIRDEPVTLLGDEEIARKIDLSPTAFHKPLLYRLTPGFHYEGNPHHSHVWSDVEGFTPSFRIPARFSYSHVKQAVGVIAQRGARNFYIGNSNRFGAKWRELRALVNRTMARGQDFADHRAATGHLFERGCAACEQAVPWHAFDRALLRGEAPPEVRDWIVAHRHDAGDGDSEVRELYLLSQRLYHPEADPFPGEHIDGQETSLPIVEAPIVGAVKGV